MMNWNAIGAIAELLAAIAILPTLIYLAIQVRQNTRAMKSAAFQQLAQAMSANSEAAVSIPHMLPIVLKANRAADSLSEEEHAYFHWFMLMAFRRIESVYIQRKLEVIDPELTEGFENSSISLLADGLGAEWWKTTKGAFSRNFVQFVDARLESGEIKPFHPGFSR